LVVNVLCSFLTGFIDKKNLFDKVSRKIVTEFDGKVSLKRRCFGR